MIKKSKKLQKIIKMLLTITVRGCIMKSQITPDGNNGGDYEIRLQRKYIRIHSSYLLYRLP